MYLDIVDLANSVNRFFISRLFVLLFCVVYCFANDEYKFNVGTNTMSDVCYDLEIVEDGYIASGHSKSWGTHTDTYDVLIHRYFSNGTMRWINSFGKETDEMVYSSSLLLDGNLVITGLTGSHHFVAVVDSDTGKEIWRKENENLNVEFRGVSGDDKGSVYVVGVIEENEKDRGLVVKFNSTDGNYEGSKMFGGDDTERFNDVFWDEKDGMIVLGYGDSWDPSGWDPIVVRLTYDLSVDWAYKFSGEITFDRFFNGRISDDKAYYLFSGYTSGVVRCICAYKFTPPPVGETLGIQICKDDTSLEAYDIVERKDGNYLVVGMEKTKEEGLLVVIEKDFSSVTESYLMTDTYDLRAAKILPYTEGIDPASESGRVIVCGTAIDRTIVIAKLDEDYLGCDMIDYNPPETTGLWWNTDHTVEEIDLEFDEEKDLVIVEPLFVERAFPPLERNMVCFTCFGVDFVEAVGDVEICSGHGDCFDYNQCLCQDNYLGVDCSNFTCFDHLRNSSSVCSYGGDCIDFNTCICDENRAGEQCELFNCYGFWSNDTDNVCSDHGQCIGHDNCSCHEDYPGDSCDMWSCFGISATNEDEVCTGNDTKGILQTGVCIDWDVCWCLPGYSALERNGICTEWLCGVNQKDEEDVCSGMGDCIAAQVCDCDVGYEGIYCDTWSCIADYKLSDLTCSGNGECVLPDTCECNTGYSGEYCKTNTLYYSVMTPILSTFGVLTIFFVITLLLCILCCFCLCICAVILGLFGFIILSLIVLIQKMRMKKFGKLKNIDLLIQEQELEEEQEQSNIASLRINKKLFEVSYKEINLECVIGEGGSSSIVYRATWRKRVVAFKCFKTRQVCSNQDSFDEFEAEITVLSSVSHPNIIRFYGGSLQPPRVGIVMEYCDNGDMINFMKRFSLENEGGFYPLEEKIRMVHEVSSAMDYLHDRKILHRDLKLENVLVDINENCKLMDFGLSRIVERISKRGGLTKKIGTNIYMSPEIINGSGSYDEKTDVYSFAILLFILITQNYKPYGKNEEYVEVKVSQNPEFRPNIEEVDEFLGENEGWLRSLIISSWDFEPNVRKSFAGILELIEEKTVVEEAIRDFDDVHSTRNKSMTVRSDSRGKRGYYLHRSSGRGSSSSSKKSNSIKDQEDRKKKIIKNEDVVEEANDGSSSSSKLLLNFEQLSRELENERKEKGMEKRKNMVMRRQMFLMKKENERMERLLKENGIKFIKRASEFIEKALVEDDQKN